MWENVGMAIIGVVLTAVVTWLITRHFQARQEISYAVLDAENPVQIVGGETFKDDIRILYRDTPVETLSLVRMVIANTGNRAVEREDFRTPMTLAFSPGVKVLRTHVAAAVPADLEAKWQAIEEPADVGRTTAQVQFDLLRPGEKFLTEFVCDGLASKPVVSDPRTRVEVKQVSLSDPASLRYLPRAFAVLIAVFAVLLAIRPAGFAEVWVAVAFYSVALAYGSLHYLAQRVQDRWHRMFHGLV